MEHTFGFWAMTGVSVFLEIVLTEFSFRGRMFSYHEMNNF